MLMLYSFVLNYFFYPNSRKVFYLIEKLYAMPKLICEMFFLYHNSITSFKNTIRPHYFEYQRENTIYNKFIPKGSKEKKNS